MHGESYRVKVSVSVVRFLPEALQEAPSLVFSVLQRSRCFQGLWTLHLSHHVSFFPCSSHHHLTFFSSVIGSPSSFPSQRHLGWHFRLT